MNQQAVKYKNIPKASTEFCRIALNSRPMVIASQLVLFSLLLICAGLSEYNVIGQTALISCIVFNTGLMLVLLSLSSLASNQLKFILAVMVMVFVYMVII
ncbi:hypothetical protein [Thalassotalea marina]|uniref:Uncharacterized protein n=1 Tax=Thalassotalea marina TaxID=1673741 RepID=A0A919BHI9_9GAMM|nr:hypothetical protein [Thalassotalea marina]GHF91585.1 hypothetical protein GCM10017161_19320 [Thalassotalea marina]